MKSIFDKTTLNKLKLNNRLFRSATWEGLAHDDGNIPEELIGIYEELAKGGVSTIITGITTVISNDLGVHRMMRFYDDKYIDKCKELTDTVHKHNCNIVIQLAIGEYGRYGMDGIFRRHEIDELTKQDIKDIVNEFKRAAIRASRAGVDGVQIHEAIRKALGEDFFITIKINSEDFVLGGLTVEDSLIACKALAAAGIDAIEVSGNYTSRTGIKGREDEGYFKEFAIQLKKLVDAPVILVGGHRSMENMNEILNSTDIEYLSLSRPLIREPELINRWNNGDTRPSTCISCNRCYNTYAHMCIFNTK